MKMPIQGGPILHNAHDVPANITIGSVNASGFFSDLGRRLLDLGSEISKEALNSVITGGLGVLNRFDFSERD